MNYLMLKNKTAPVFTGALLKNLKHTKRIFLSLKQLS